MPTITLNGVQREFTAGQTILDVARAAEVEVPTLCWYPKLPNVANCRICLVSVEGQGKLVPSCGTPARFRSGSVRSKPAGNTDVMA